MLGYTLAVAAKRARRAAGVSWPMDQSGWMAWDEDHLAEGFRHSSGEIGADGVWASLPDGPLPWQEATCRWARCLFKITSRDEFWLRPQRDVHPCGRQGTSVRTV